MKVIKKDDKQILYKVIEKNTKHSYIKVENGYLLITKSKNMNIDYILKSIYKKFDYYYNVSKKKSSNTLSLWGIKYNIILKESDTFNYLVKDSEIIVYTNNNNYQSIKEEILKKELHDYLNEILPNIKQHLTIYGYYMVPIKLKYLKSKYGSYNTNRKKEYIVLNTFLATLDKQFLLYVLYHEFTHQKVKNHQKEFYVELNKLFPAHRTYQKQLKNFKLII